jgi:3-hydroxyisobutyrate dehydrogenase-like beta-hydroxyacid dehydrogenase
MGRAVALRLLGKRHEVVVWNRSPGKAEQLVEHGATAAATVAEAVAGADVILTLLSDDAAVKQVSLGPDGAISAMPEDSVLVDMSTVHPETSRLLAASAPEDRFLDAPIMGGPHTVTNGQAKYLVGGPEHLVRRLEPLWSDLGAEYFYTGPNGTATTLKLLSNLILVGSTELLMEAVVTAQASGIGEGVLREVFGGSPAVAPGARARLEDILGGDHHGWWTLELADKDMSLALELASEAHLELPVGAAIEGVVRRAIEAGYGDLDLGAIAEVLRARQHVR